MKKDLGNLLIQIQRFMLENPHANARKIAEALGTTDERVSRVKIKYGLVLPSRTAHMEKLVIDYIAKNPSWQPSSMARDLDVPLYCVRLALKKQSISIPPKPDVDLVVQDYLQSHAPTYIGKIAGDTSVNRERVKEVADKMGATLVSKGQATSSLAAILNDQNKTLLEIAYALNAKPVSVFMNHLPAPCTANVEWCDRNTQKKYDGIRKKYLDDATSVRITQLAKRGLTTQKIARAAGVSPQYVSQFIISNALHATWGKSKIEYKRVNRLVTDEVKANVLYVLRSRVKYLIDTQAQTSAHLTAEYMMQTNINSKRPQEKLLLFFDKYLVQKRGNAIHYSELAKVFGAHCAPSSATYILGKVGLHIPKANATTSLDTVNQTVFNLGELSYFTGHSLSSLQRKIQKGRKSIRHFDAGAKKVSLQIASKVYEASDVGFTPTEICEYAQCNSAQYKHAVDQRNTLEHLLVRNLQILFPSRNQQKPYL